MSADEAFKVSVIIPVYNAALRVRSAVESVLGLPAVGEIILVEDGSDDSSLSVCKVLEEEFALVTVIQHEGGTNRGAGASRNLGVKRARFGAIAFLDADDRYLPGRFDADARLLAADETLDGCYNAIANEYESESSRELWLSQGRADESTLSAPVPPEELIRVLFWNHPTVTGQLHTNGITVRREFFERLGGFNESLRLQQDTHLWKRMAAGGRLAPGTLKRPVAIRVVHSGNRMTRMEEQNRYNDLWWESLGAAFREMKVPRSTMQLWRRAYASYQSRSGNRAKTLLALSRWVARNPEEFKIPYGHFDLTLRTLFRETPWIISALSLKNRIFGTTSDLGNT